jgi:flagellar biosynthesis/type III secretory pathway protein FliH
MGRRIPAQELQSMLDAGEVYRASQRYLEQAQLDVRKAKADATRSGFVKGFEAGRNLITDKVKEIEAVFGARRDAMEGGLADIVKSCLEKLLDDMPPHDRVLSQLRRAINEHPSVAMITIKVPHDKVAETRSIASTSGDVRVSNLRIEGDALLTQGDMLLETPQGRVHIGMEGQLNRLNTAMRRAEEAYDEGD